MHSISIALPLAFCFFCLLSFTCFPAHGQYRPCITEGSEWNLHFHGLVGDNFSGTISGDTVVNGMTYWKYADIFHETDHYLREDSLEKKIYLLGEDTTTETVLYDFNLTVGDTFQGLEYQIVLDSITDTIRIDGADCMGHTPPLLNLDHPKIYFFHQLPVNWWNEFNPVVWVEGIGSLSNLVYGSDQLWYDEIRVICHSDSSGFRDYHYTSCEEENCLGPIWGEYGRRGPRTNQTYRPLSQPH